ncbi:thioredoxin TrxC [Novosphingobium sp. B 225]|uniref:thioredoxin TrxC n=1 Tax=Novosphingobium sp. B 225 TaxID=1961849 RepID=UPI000B4A70D1|nr:thioredoxin TrxC [Novosphingobium sp. B 225]
MPQLPDPVVTLCPHCGAANRVPAARLSAHPTCGKCKAALFTGAPLAVDQAQFDRHMGPGKLPVLVDFWAEWCGPCKAMAPAFAQAAKVLEPQLRLLKIDTEAAPALSQRYQIRSIPTLMLLAGGREVARTAGAMPVEGIVRWVRSVS